MQFSKLVPIFQTPPHYQGLDDQTAMAESGGFSALFAVQGPFGPQQKEIPVDNTGQAFYALGPGLNRPDTVLVLENDRTLWFKSGPFGQPPPNFWTSQQQVDANAQTFQALDIGLSNPDTVFVLGTDGKLWLEQGPFNQPAPKFWTNRWQVDAQVLLNMNVSAFLGIDTVPRAFQALDINTVLVLGSNGNLWLEHGPFGQPAPNFWTAREQVDGNVQAFIGIDSNEVVVLGLDGNLWDEFAPFGPGHVPPNRTPLGSNVQAFAVLDTVDTLLMVTTDGTMWFQGQQIDGVVNVVNCQAIGRFTRPSGLQTTEVLAGLMTDQSGLSYFELPLG